MAEADMINDCQNENLLRLSYSDLPIALQYAVDRCVDRVKNGENLPREELHGFDAYAYRVSDRISRGVNSPEGLNIFRDQIVG
jgi:hypothetical protein